MNRAATLEQLTKLCNLNREGVAPPAIEATGFPQLDAALPNRGWQSGTLVELIPTDIGIGELRLLMPALARMTQSDRHVALIAPPFVPFAPALIQHGVRLDRLLVIQAPKNEDALWALEQVLRCNSFGAALAWPTSVKDKEIRRLQLAAETGRSIGFIYRAPHAARNASPAAMRLSLQATGSELKIDILKCRGGRAGFSVAVNCPLSGQSFNSPSHENPPLMDAFAPVASKTSVDRAWSENLQTKVDLHIGSADRTRSTTVDALPICAEDADADFSGQLPVASGQ
ncbi:MAG: translesion DNA synthesis-associated protein ImuA [Povalibacter sp.]